MTPTQRNLLGFTFTLIVVIIYLGVFFAYLFKLERGTVRYDCSISEISPDFPPEVREQCRKLRSGRV
jgi:hypothetical protein